MNAQDLPRAVKRLSHEKGWEEATALVERHWTFAETEPHHLLNALKELPGVAFVENPMLSVAARHVRSVVEGRRRAPHTLRDAPLSERSDLFLRLTMLTHESVVARARGLPAEASGLAEAALQQLESATPEQVDDIADAVPQLRLEWASSLDAIDSPRARLEYHHAYELAVAAGQPMLARRAASQAAWLHAERGRSRTAEAWLTRATHLAGPDERNDAVLHLTKALLKTDRDDLPGAKAELAAAGAIGVGEYWAADLWVRSLYAHNVADAAITESLMANRIQEHPGVLNSVGFDGRLTRAARARVLSLRGRILEDLDTYIDLSLSDRVVAAAIARAMHQDHAAFRLSRTATEDGAEPRLQSTALLVHAAAAHALGLAETAKDAFLRADALIQYEGLHAAYECIARTDLEKLLELSGTDTTGIVRVHSARRDLPDLTKRENDVLALLTTELTMDEIARNLYISRNTLKTLTRRLYKKLDVKSRAAAVDHAHRAGVGR